MPYMKQPRNGLSYILGLGKKINVSLHNANAVQFWGISI